MASSFDSRRLRDICSKTETVTQATAILSIARLKTGSGSGHELGPFTSGLIAICAYIASKRLNNNDVTQKNAQIASCLRPQDFEKALGIVESALSGPKPATRTRKSTGVTYQSLFRTNGIVESPTMVRMMHEAEEIVFQEAAEASRREVVCLVFFWTCKVLKIPGFMAPEDFQAKYEIPLNNYNFVIKILQKKCNEQKEALKDEWQATQDAQAKELAGLSVKASRQQSSSPTKSPSKRPLRTLPSKDPKTCTTELYAPTTDAGTATPTSPTKRRKLDAVAVTTQPPPIGRDSLPIPGPSSVLPSRIQPIPVSVSSDHEPTTPRRPQRVASLSPTKSPRKHHTDALPAMDVDEASDRASEGDSPDILVSRRFRPVFLDHKQWYRRDPRLARIWRAAETHRDNMAKLYPHPFEQYRPQIE